MDKAKPSYKISIQTEYIEKIKGSFDSIVLGNVLCEIPKWQKAITEVDRLLKPGGRVYFSEHVLDGEGSWRRFFQQKMRPWWFVVSGGCDCARPILDELKKTEWDVKSWTVNVRERRARAWCDTTGTHMPSDTRATRHTDEQCIDRPV